MSDNRKGLKFISKMMIAVMLFLVAMISNPLTAYADRRDDLLGVWRGTYFNNAGIMGKEMAIFRDGAAYVVKVWFFPIEGSPATQRPGSSRSDISFDANTGRFVISNSVWIPQAGFCLIEQTLHLLGIRLLVNTTIVVICLLA